MPRTPIPEFQPQANRQKGTYSTSEGDPTAPNASTLQREQRSTQRSAAPANPAKSFFALKAEAEARSRGDSNAQGKANTSIPDSGNRAQPQSSQNLGSFGMEIFNSYRVAGRQETGAKGAASASQMATSGYTEPPGGAHGLSRHVPTMEKTQSSTTKASDHTAHPDVQSFASNRKADYQKFLRAFGVASSPAQESTSIIYNGPSSRPGLLQCNARIRTLRMSLDTRAIVRERCMHQGTRSWSPKSGCT